MDGFWKRKMVMLVEKGRLTEYTADDLVYYDGKDGRPAYVAVDNVVYDVTEIVSWQDGMHFGIVAGTDATKDFEMCHKLVTLEKLNIVGKLVE